MTKKGPNNNFLEKQTGTQHKFQAHPMRRSNRLVNWASFSATDSQPVPSSLPLQVPTSESKHYLLFFCFSFEPRLFSVCYICSTKSCFVSVCSIFPYCYQPVPVHMQVPVSIKKQNLTQSPAVWVLREVASPPQQQQQQQDLVCCPCCKPTTNSPPLCYLKIPRISCLLCAKIF